LIAIALGEVFAGPIIQAYNPSKDAAIIERATMVARMLFPQTIFLFLAGMCVGVLNGHKLFQRAAFTTTLYNVVCIFFMLRWGDDSPGAPAKVALGVVISAAINFFYLAFMARRVIHYKPMINLKDEGYRRLLRLAVPTLISGTVIQLNSIIQTAFANQFTGAVTSLRHAQTTWKLPYGIFALAVASVMSPNLTRAFANRRFEDMRMIYTQSLRRALYFVTPFILIFAVMAEETMEAVFQWGGAIPMENLLIEGQLLRLYVPAIFFLTFYEVVNQAFYARHVTRISLATSVVSLILNPLFCILFTRVLDFGIYGLPLAYVLNSAINMVLISTLYRLHIKKARPYRMLPFYLRILLCSATTVIVTLGLNTLPLDTTSKGLQLLIYTVKALLAMLTYYLTGLAIDLREARDLQGVIRAVDNYLTRRFVCGYPTNALNKIFALLYRETAKLRGSTDTFSDVMTYQLMRRQGSGTFPSDQEFTDALRTKDFYHISTAQRTYLIDSLENRDSNDVRDIAAALQSGAISVEHIMPQTLTPEWRADLGPDHERIHETWLHRLANLTVTGYNSTYSNLPFVRKRDREDGFRASPYRLNGLLREADHWGEAEMQQRSDWFVEVALSYWRTPVSRYQPRPDAKDVEALGEDTDFTGRTLRAWEFEGVQHPVTTWKQMTLEVVAMLADKDPAGLHRAARENVLMRLRPNPATPLEAYQQEAVPGITVQVANPTATKIWILRDLFHRLGLETDELVFHLAPAEASDDE